MPKKLTWDPNFCPCYTPMEMLDFGVLEGIYTHAIKGIHDKYKTHPNVLGDKTCRPKQRQGLLQWAWDSNKPVTDKALETNLKCIVNAFQKSLYTW